MNLYPVLAITNLFAVIVQYVFNALASTGPDGTIFINKTGDLSDKYYTEITPAGWTFSIWGIIYTWQALWIVFTVTNICRKTSRGEANYEDPKYIPNALFIISIIVAGANIGWLISFDRQEIELSAAVLIIYSLLMYIMLFFVYRALDAASPKLVMEKRNLDIWLTRGLVANGIAIQMTWVSIATLLNIQMVLIYSGDELVSVEDAGTIALSALAVLIAVYGISDLVFFDRFSRYTLTPHLVLIMALSGSISKNWNSEKRNSIFTAVLLALCCLLSAVKLVLTLYRHFTRPRFNTAYRSTLETESKTELANTKQ